MTKSNWFIYLSTFDKKKRWKMCQQPFYKITENSGQLISSNFYQQILTKDKILKIQNHEKIISFGVVIDYSYQEIKQIMDEFQCMNKSHDDNIYTFSLTREEFMNHVRDMKLTESKRIQLFNGRNIMEIHVLYTHFDGNNSYILSTPSYSIYNYRQV
jgi:hypothetical protein